MNVKKHMECNLKKQASKPWPEYVYKTLAVDLHWVRIVSDLENQHFIKWLSIFLPLSKYEPALQVKTDHARFVHLPALSEHEKKTYS